MFIWGGSFLSCLPTAEPQPFAYLFYNINILLSHPQIQIPLLVQSRSRCSCHPSMEKKQAYYSQSLCEKYHLDLAPRNDPKPVGEPAVLEWEPNYAIYQARAIARRPSVHCAQWLAPSFEITHDLERGFISRRPSICSHTLWPREVGNSRRTPLLSRYSPLIKILDQY